MESDAEIIIAFIFKRSGKQKLKLSEFYLPLSMQLNWFSPQEAKDFVKIAIKQKVKNHLSYLSNAFTTSRILLSDKVFFPIR